MRQRGASVVARLFRGGVCVRPAETGLAERQLLVFSFGYSLGQKTKQLERNVRGGQRRVA
jgi:hypothetical protein